MKTSLLLVSTLLVSSLIPAFARGHSHSSGSGRSHSGYHEHFAKEVHQFRGGHEITIRPRHAQALHFYSKH